MEYKETIEDQVAELQKKLGTLDFHVHGTEISEIKDKISILQSKRKKQYESCLKILLEVGDLMRDDELRDLVMEVVGDEKFQNCTAARKRHQAYKGGLVVHTFEVLDIALKMAESSCLKLNTDILITAIIFHDYGKIYDYEDAPPGGEHRYLYTKHQELIRHLPRSYAVFMARSEGKVDEDTRMAIAHCILSHHGRHEWGSPVGPLTTEANIIHFADMMSANCSLDIYE
jgi:3'-5' exoribonuclease